jgi:outer membrane protein X
MKRVFILTALIAVVLMAVTPQYLSAQTTKGAMRIGAQLGYGTEIESLGIGARFDYAITEQILLAPDLMYFFGKSESNFDLSWFDINLNGNYLFDIGNAEITPYALAGLNFGILSVDYDYPSGIPGTPGDTSSTEIGLNIGGGADFLVGTLTLFGEIRYVLGDADQLVIAAGAKFPIN